MRRVITTVAFVVFAVVTATLVTASGNSTIVTNPTPALSAAMTLTGSSPAGDFYFWNVQGKVKPAYRGFGGDVRLVCTPYASLLAGGNAGQVVLGPSCGDLNFCAPTIDACGNFNFNATVGGAPQLDNGYVCTFIVHVDASKTPQACNKPPAPGDFPSDPNGSAPCSGGLCPDAP